ncbi:oxidative stress survival Svf1-like protein [Trametes meyenii]|nr:oxidative stress survival Svf1-like protein [Trametes meyenii]
MFSAIFSTSPPVNPAAPNFHPVSSIHTPTRFFGALEREDTEWACPGGFAVETQIFYIFLDDGSYLIFQIIHSAMGVWYPTIQLVCKLINPHTQEKTWKSVKTTNFITPPPGLDKRSSKADQFSITHKPNPGAEHPESYVLTANLGDDLQISLDVSRPTSAPGFKVGQGPGGGYSYFGTNRGKPDGYVVHRFWPLCFAKGMVVRHGRAIPAKGQGMFVHAIQGMRADHVASRWNFAHFQSPRHGGVSAIQMEFTTTNAFGRTGAGSGHVTVNVGGLVLGGKLATVTAETKWPDEEYSVDGGVVSRAIHSKTAHDTDTGYDVPTDIIFRWNAPSILPDVDPAQGTIDATLTVDVGQPDAPKGLVEKVDVLGEIPTMVKTMVNYVAGAKPYVYQWLNPATLHIKLPAELVPGLSQEAEVEGTLYNEATFIS